MQRTTLRAGAGRRSRTGATNLAQGREGGCSRGAPSQPGMSQQCSHCPRGKVFLPSLHGPPAACRTQRASGRTGPPMRWGRTPRQTGRPASPGGLPPPPAGPRRMWGGRRRPDGAGQPQRWPRPRQQPHPACGEWGRGGEVARTASQVQALEGNLSKPIAPVLPLPLSFTSPPLGAPCQSAPACERSVGPWCPPAPSSPSPLTLPGQPWPGEQPPARAIPQV